MTLLLVLWKDEINSAKTPPLSSYYHVNYRNYFLTLPAIA